MKTLSCFTRWLLVSAFSLLLLGCGGGGGGTDATTLSPAGTGTVTLLVTDAPSDDFNAINLTVTRAELLSDRGRIELFSGQKTFDLLQLATATEIFSVTDVPAGSYNKIRLTLSNIELVLKDGSKQYPPLPGNGKLDLNPRGSFYVEPGTTLMIQLDMDAEKSIHVAGPRYNFRPVVFVDIVTSPMTTKLVRVTGTVQALDTVSGDFDLCRVRGQNDYIDYRRDDDRNDDSRDDLCLMVDTATTDASFFDVNGDPVTIDALADGDVVTAAGRFAFSGKYAASKAGHREERGDRDGRDDDHDQADTDHDDDYDRRKMVLVAEVVWMGTYADVKGVARSEVTSDSERGRWFQLEVLPGQGYSFDAPIATIVQGATRLFLGDGSPATAADVQPGVLARVDGVFQSNTDLKAALVVLRKAHVMAQLTGTVASVADDYGSLVLMTDSGDRCVSVPPTARVFETALDADDTIVFEQRTAFDLAGGQKADVFGNEQADGCLAADTIIYEEPAS